MKIYIIEKICCRGEEETNKFVFDSKKIKDILNEMIQERSVKDWDWDYSDKLSRKVEEFSVESGYHSYEGIIYSLLDNSYEEDINFQERVDSLEGEGFNVEGEENVIGIGNSKVKALANLAKIDMGDSW